MLGPSSVPLLRQPAESAQHPEAEHWEAKMSTPFMEFGDKEMYKDGISARLKLTRSLRKEFEDNLGGRYIELFDYVFKGPAKEEYPSVKGSAPTPADIPAYTRDLGRDGWTLDDFLTKPGQTPGELSKLDVGMLRLYTGPVFKPWNFYLRYGPLGPKQTKHVLCCSNTPYHEKDEKFGAFHPGKLFVDDPANRGTCKTCGRAKSAHSEQLLADDWSTSIALLYSAIVKLANQTTEVGVVHRGIDESKVQFPPGFVGRSGMADGNELLGGVEPGFMSTTKDRHVASLFAKNEGSLFQIQLKTTSRGAQLSRFSMYEAEEEMLFPPYTMLSCHGASIEIGPSGEKQRILRVDATFNPDTRLMDMVDGINTEGDEPVSGSLARLLQRTGKDESQLLTEERLDLRGCKLDHKHIPALCYVIKQNQSLRFLDLRDNEPDLEAKGLQDDAQLDALAHSLRGHTCIEAIHFSKLWLRLGWIQGGEDSSAARPAIGPFATPERWRFAGDDADDYPIRSSPDSSASVLMLARSGDDFFMSGLVPGPRYDSLQARAFPWLVVELPGFPAVYKARPQVGQNKARLAWLDRLIPWGCRVVSASVCPCGGFGRINRCALICTQVSSARLHHARLHRQRPLESPHRTP